MAGRGGNNNSGRAGRGAGGRGGGRGGRGNKRANNASSTTTTPKTVHKGLCADLEGNVFDIGQRTSADLLRSTLIKLVQYVGTKYGEEIADELVNRYPTPLPPPQYTPEVIRKHTAKVALKRSQQNALLGANQTMAANLQAELALNPNPARTLELVQLNNTIAQLQHDLAEDIPYKLDEEEKVEHDSKVKSHIKLVENIKDHRGKVFMLIMGQCTQRLQDKLKQDISWPTVDATPKDPIELLNLIERVVLKQSETDQYPWATIHEADMAVKNLRQGNMTDSQWVEKMRTRHEIAKSVGVERFCTVWVDYCARAKYSRDYDALSLAEQKDIRDEAEERYIAYLIVVNSGTQHENLRNSLAEDFAKKVDKYPKTIQEAQVYLDKFPKKTIAAMASEGTAFAQKGGKQNKGGDDKSDKPSYNKKFFADKECFNCGKVGHPADACPNPPKDGKADGKKKKGGKKKADDDDDDASVASLSKKLEKGMKSMQRTLAQIAEKTDDDSDISEEESHFQFSFAQLQHIESTHPRTANVLKQSHPSLCELDMNEVILLDSQSTIDVFCNRKLLDNIKRAKKPLRLRSNGGSMMLNKVASIDNYYGKVWYSSNAITNILSLKNVIKQYRVTYDSEEGLYFIVHRSEHGAPDMYFEMHESGLHYYDPRNQQNEFAFVETVEGNKALFTKRQLAGAEKARQLFMGLSYPSMTDFIYILRSNGIKECPVTVRDAEIALKVWGPNVAGLKGKTVRKAAKSVKVEDLIPIPKSMIAMHKDVTLGIDIFFVNKIPFFVTLSRNICFTSATHLPDRKLSSIFDAFKKMYNYYLKRGFRITTVMADGEFAPLQTMFQQLYGAPQLNLTAANEHEPFVERRIRVIKERVRSVRHSLPFKSLPRKLVANMVLFSTKLLNYFPTKGGISTTLSPKAIMSGEQINYKDYKLPFGSYCQVHEDTEPRNSLAARTQGAISLGPSGNMQHAQRFLSLKTGEVITRYAWDVLPMPNGVIERVNALGHDQPEQLTFTNRHGATIGDVDEIAGVAGDDDNDDDDDGANDLPGELDDDVDLPGVDTGIDDDDQAPPDLPEPEIEPNEPNIVQFEPDLIEQPPLDEQVPVADEPVQEVEQQPTGLRRSSRARVNAQRYVPSMQGNRYSYAAAQIAAGVLNPDAHIFMQEDFYQCDIDVAATVLAQISLKQALKLWGDDAKRAVEAEAKQLHWRKSFKPVHRKDLTATQLKQILESHMFLTKKRDGLVKARKVAGGNKQRDYIAKEDASSPTCATESVLLSCAIDAKENRESAVVDIPNAFIQTVVEDEKDKVVIRIRGMMVDVLCKIAPDVYEPYVAYDKKGNKQLLVICLNALYGTMVASLLYYKKFTSSLRSKAFTMNPYDPCVWNKMVNKEQLTIVFHVDDCKLSHRDPKVLDETIEWLRQDYESIFEDGSGKMKVSRGKVHKYLGMTLDYSTPGECKITMIDYVDEILAAWEKVEPLIDEEGFEKVQSKARKTKTSAAPENLFKVDDDCKKLNSTKATAFHNIVAKALYITKRARPDISVAIAFLTTRVREPDLDDWEKLSHLMKYLRGTRELPLLLGGDNTGIVKWYVDASFAVHPNMRGHTGGAVTLGRGCPIVTSTKQKLNTRSSTEAELVGVDDLMPAILWTRYFLKAQGYDVKENILYQDNMSSILLARNGKASSSKRTKHIAIRYFFITDRISKGHVNLEWCPTTEMIADFMSKPLQGSLFRKFRDIIMGIDIVKPGVEVRKKTGDEVSKKSGNVVGKSSKSSGKLGKHPKSTGKSLARY